VADIAGDYVVKLVVADSYDGTSFDQITLTAQAPPVAEFIYAPGSPTTWDVIRFTDLSSDLDGTITRWSWVFGDAELTSEQNPTHWYRDPGMYQVSLTVTDNDGLTASTIQEIRISLGPGDITGDGAIDVTDVPLCLQIATGVVTGTLEERAAADVNGDGDVDLTDAQILAEYIIGIRSPLLEGGQP
jgi:hypothetical protein